MDSQSEKDLSCPVCHDIFKDPVLISCSHSFCKDCLQKWWREKEIKECPVCKERHNSLTDPPQNLTLKNFTALRKEEKQNSQTMKVQIEALSRELKALSDTIRAAEDEMRAEDVSFVQNCKAAVERVQQHHLPDDPQLVSGALINEAKHLGNLSYNLWNKMKEMVSYTPVILDPNSAHPELLLSEDLTSLRCGHRQILPKNPERFESSISVLGSEGFDSGIHSWDVEVGNSPTWILGVAAESFQRNKDTASQSGLWRILFYKDEYTAWPQADPSPVLSGKKFQRIRVQLKFKKEREKKIAKLSFSDPDTGTHIHSFRYTFTDKLFPYFNTNKESPLKILSQRVYSGTY